MNEYLIGRDGAILNKGKKHNISQEVGKHRTFLFYFGTGSRPIKLEPFDGEKWGWGEPRTHGHVGRALTPSHA